MRLGYPADHGQAVLDSQIPPAYAGRLTLVIEAVLDCPAVTRRACAAAVNDTVAGLLRTSAPGFGDIQAWPALYVDGSGGDDRYRHDYIVLVDRGDNDVYDNNAGGNLIDHRRGPAGSQALIKGNAIGCEQVQGNFPAPNPATSDCIAVPQAVLLDQKAPGKPSNDIYGVFKSPRTVDHNPPPTGSRLVDGDCTTDTLIRRIILQGSGFAGNGLLWDKGGNDRYRGKTSAQGAGHIGGVGILRDLGGGADSYLVIRNSQGFGLADGIGIQQDDGGNDRYTTYMPSPKNPNAPFQAPGSGGVVDDTGVCDDMPRMVQGTALLGGSGALLDDNGRVRGSASRHPAVQSKRRLVPRLAGIWLQWRVRSAARPRP